MSKIQKRFAVVALTFLVVCLLGVGSVSAEKAGPEDDGNSVAGVTMSPRGLNFQPKVEFGSLILTIVGPDGVPFSKTFNSGSSPYLDLPGTITDGLYTFELRVIPASVKKDRLSAVSSEGPVNQKAQTQTGNFTVEGGKILLSGTAESIAKPMDVLHYDDVIITGSLCIGFDCANGESFGYDTLKLKENNLRLYFEDTSVGSFPSGDWRIRINDTTSGGASYFAVEDGTNGRTPFRIETGAPTHSLYVEDYGRVGLGTSIPYVELHIVDGDSPTIRLDQDGSSGWTAQRWDLCGNETNFFIRDVTNGSKLCFRIQPNTPSNTLCMRSTGYVGIGTWSPSKPLEVETTGEDATMYLERTSGAIAQISGKSDKTMFGSRTNHKLNLTVDNDPKFTIDTSGRVGIGDTTPSYPIEVATANGAYLNTSGNWVNPSSRALKENIRALSAGEAVKALKELAPVKFNYKVDKTDGYVGFIAEDVPELVAVKERKGMVAMDVVAVLTKVVQEQQKTIDELKKEMAELKKK